MWSDEPTLSSRSPTLIAALALSLAVSVAPACSEPQDDHGLHPAGPLACAHTVFYRLPAGGAVPAQVSVVGPFNDWQPGVDPLVDPDGDGLYVGQPRFQPGWQTYLIEVDGEQHLDAFEPLTLFDDSGSRELSAARIEDCSRPALRFDALQASASGELTARLTVRAALTGGRTRPQRAEATLEDGSVLEARLLTDGAQAFVEVTARRLTAGKHVLRVTVTDEAGRESEAVSAPFWVEPARFDWRDATIYQVFVDRFRRAGGEPLADAVSITAFHGGDLWGVLEAIEDGYFASLGVNTLWLSPLYENPDGWWMGRLGMEAQAYHGYWPVDSRRVSERFGGEDALEAVVTAAHARGMRVIVDVVMNHVHWDHAYHRRGPAWINRDPSCICGSEACPWHEAIVECWFDPFLPDLDWRNRELVEAVTADALWWIERFDVDGLRLDAVPMMPRLAMRHLRERVERARDPVHTHTYLLGETYTGRGEQDVIRYWLGDHTLSGQFDFPVMWALREALAGRTGLSLLDLEVRASAAAFDEAGAVMAPMLGNHDVPRFISDVNGDTVWSPGQVQPGPPQSEAPYRALEQAWSFVLTQPGAPVIYNGDEYGEPGAYDPDNRRNTRFAERLAPRERQVLEHTARTGRARACSVALRRGARHTLYASADLYVYGREAGDGRPAVVMLNTSSVALAVEVELPEDWALAMDWRPADVHGAAFALEGRTLRGELAAQGSAVIVDGGCAAMARRDDTGDVD